MNNKNPVTALKYNTSEPNPLLFDFLVDHKGALQKFTFAIRRALIAGFAARDRAATQHHIDELEDIGVAPPSSVPMFYEVSSTRLTQRTNVDMIGSSSSGEVECIILQVDNELFVGLGSDHTDRDLEAVGIMQSKQLCDKPISNILWRYSDLAQHWDTIIMRCWADFGDGAFELYQEGTLSELMAPETLFAEREEIGKPMCDGDLMFCGTFSAKGGIRPAVRYRLELEDPVLERKLAHVYVVTELALRA